MRNAFRAAAILAGSVLLVGSAVEASDPPALGVPDAPPPVERLIARADGVRLAEAIQMPDGRKVPAGSYDLAVIECGGRYWLQITSRGTRRGFRSILQPNADSGERALAPSAEGFASIRFAPNSLEVIQGEFTTTFPLGGSPTTG